MRPLANSFISVELVSSSRRHWWVATPERDTGIFTLHSSRDFLSREEALKDWTELAETNGWNAWTVVPNKYEVKRICRDCNAILSVGYSSDGRDQFVPCDRGCE